jgi:hypothetical protein
MPLLPEILDLSELMPAVTDQGQTGSSVAHAVSAMFEARGGVAELEDDIEAASRRAAVAEHLRAQTLQEMDATILRDLEGAARANLSRLALYQMSREVEPIREAGHELPIDYVPGRAMGSMTLERVVFDPIVLGRVLGEHRPNGDPGTFNREALRTLRDEIERRPLRAGGLGIPYFQAPLQISRLTPQPLPLQSEVDRHNAESIRAAEDEEIFRRLDEVAAGREFVVTGMRTEFPPGSPVVVEDVPFHTPDHRPEGVRLPLRGRPEHLITVDDAGFGPPNENGDVFPLRQELTVLGPDVPRDGPTLGWTVRERPGIAVINPNIMRGQRVTVPEFEIAANPTVHMADIKARRFDMLDRNFEVGEWVVLRLDEEHPMQIMRIDGDVLFVQGFDFVPFTLVGLIHPVPKQDVRRVSAPVMDVWHRLLLDEDLF